MSFELPECYVISHQLDTVLKNKTIINYKIKNYEKLQKNNALNKEIKFFDKLLNNQIVSVESKSSMILINLKTNHILLIGPEYGGEIQFVKAGEEYTEKYQLKITFSDNSYLYILIKGFGYCYLYDHDKLGENYVYRRDYKKIQANDDENLTLKILSTKLKEKNKNIKVMLVGKEAIISGIANSLFQEIIFEAGIHPREKSSDLTDKQIKNLLSAITTIINNRITQKGKHKVVDIYGQKGGYKPVMDSSF
ncbi:MAG: DNA-formamidopyrimidine glycosylase family protein, partial [Candidatus Thorarchaeota archaeon]